MGVGASMRSFPSRYSPLKNKEIELKGLRQHEHVKEEHLTDLRSKRSSYKRGRGGRDQGYATKWQRRVPGLKSYSNRRNVRETGKFNLGSKQGRRTNAKSSGRGLRTVRRRRVEMMVAEEPLIGRMTSTVGPRSYGGSLRNLGEENWGAEKVRTDADLGMDVDVDVDVDVDLDDADNNSVEAGESDDNVEAEGYEQRNWEQSFNGASNRWNRTVMEVSDDDGDASGDDMALKKWELKSQRET
ncbi:hypothetical protein GH714_002610 [Hevea brasiliensis]|uniref:Uncharacterized protein n=1 Tax=Hevea brasiliensis TaxID=3981 RepID=A0A6A6L8J4_HEVBR|nr:hypothetical protein GH714_002610 [Hevea brasiliensis]